MREREREREKVTAVTAYNTLAWVSMAGVAVCHPSVNLLCGLHHTSLPSLARKAQMEVGESFSPSPVRTTNRSTLGPKGLPSNLTSAAYNTYNTTHIIVNSTFSLCVSLSRSLSLSLSLSLIYLFVKQNRTRIDTHII